MTGYVDQRPIASNANEAGKQQNRRVEVLILPTQVRSRNAVAAQPAGARQPAGAAPAQPKLNKDGPKIAAPAGEQTSTAAPTTPSLNK